MKIKKFTLISLVLYIIFVTFISINVKAYANEITIESKIPCQATLDDDFDDKSIIVTLSNAESLLLKEYHIDDFSDVNCIAVEDLTDSTTEIIREELIAEQTGDWSNLQERIETNMLVDITTFHRVLYITLDVSNKQNVLDKIKVLERRMEIISAEPDYIENLNVISHSPLSPVNAQWGLNGTFGINANKTWI